MTFNLAIIGGGPAGYTAAEKAAKAGMSVVLFEKNELGGVCLNEGCIPTKALLSCAKHYSSALGGATFGVRCEGVKADFAKMQERKVRTVRRLAGGVKARMRDAGVEVVRAQAAVRHPGVIEAGGSTYGYERLLLCTGSSAVIPPIPGAFLSDGSLNPAVMTSREALQLSSVPQSIAIIGGGVIGMEFASLLSTLGAKVSVVEMLPEILGGFDAEISAMLRGIYAKRGVDFHLGVKVLSIDGGCVNFEGGSLSAERILISTGRRPNLEGILIPGLKTARGIEVDCHMRTNVEGVYAAGDVTGFSMLAHTASREAEVAVNDMLGVPDEMDYNAVPGVVYTNPEVAFVGKRLEDAGEGAKALCLPMAWSGRFVAENEDITGICKLVLDAKGKVVGAHMLGTPCSEIISAAGVAISAGMTAAQLQKVIFPHPSVAEIIKETANS